MVPYKQGVTERTITVTYDPDKVEPVDLCALTTKIEKAPGVIEGTNIEVVSFEKDKGVIEYRVTGITTAVINSVKFIPKVDGMTKILYNIK
jgi:hypothetical protein